MGCLNFRTGVETPWPEFFCPGYKLESVKKLLTDEFLVGVSQGFAERAIPQAIQQDNSSDMGVKYTTLHGHPVFFSGIRHTAYTTGSLTQMAMKRLQPDLLRAFQNDESDEAIAFFWHCSKTIKDWWDSYSKSEKCLAMMRDVEARIDKHNVSEWARVKETEGGMKCKR